MIFVPAPLLEQFVKITLMLLCMSKESVGV
jgi:hypothetical protein